MPRRKVVHDLKQCCLLNVARHMEDIWCADYTKNFKDQGNYMYIIGPFMGLTSDLIQDLIYVLTEKKLMKRYFLHLLIDIHLDRLDLSPCKMIANKDSIINLVSIRCTKLTRLNIALFNQVSARTLADMVDSLPRLVSLNLRQTKCTDQVLNRIGHTCKELRELNIFGCPVTDMGILSLCVTFDPKDKKLEKLARLDIGCTAVTCKGVQYALAELKNLQFLVYPDVCEVLYRLHHKDYKEGVDVPKEKIHYLRNLFHSNLKSNLSPVEKTIEVSVAFCPYVTEVHFVRGLTNESILQLSNLEHLQVLNVANSDEELVTFNEGLLPLLQVRGKTLEDLALFEINGLDLGAIAALCPNLRKFSCLVAGFPKADFPMNSHPELIEYMLQSHKPFTKLEQVRVLLHTETNNFPVQYVKILTKNAASLKEVHFAFVQTLTDDSFFNIIASNKMEQLEKITLESCNHITGAVGSVLLELPNNLRHLLLKDCLEITRKDYDKFTKLVRENCFDTNVEWT